MVRTRFFMSLLASSAVVAMATAPAHAGEVERAREAIAAADAKIHTAETLGAGVEAPAATAEARAELTTAREDFQNDHRGDAMRHAIQAQALADTAIGDLQQRKNDRLAAAHAAERENAAAAQAQVNAAQQQAADANARATAAEQSAAQSAAEAENARNAAAAAAAQNSQVETTVTTEHKGAAHHASRTKVVKRKSTSTPTTSEDVTTTTTHVTGQ